MAYNYNPYGAWNPEQVGMSKAVSPYIQSKVGTESPTYTGQFTAPLEQGEQDVISQNSRINALSEQGLSSLLKGEFPEDYYQNSIYKPLLKQYKEDILPGIEESYAGPNGAGYWGSARAGAVGKGYQDTFDTLASKRAELGWQAQQNIPNAVNAANTMATTGAAIQAIPRTIRQYGLEQQYNDWTRAQGANQKYIDNALSFLGLSSGTAEYVPEKTSMIGNALNAFGTSAANSLGSNLFNSSNIDWNSINKPRYSNANNQYTYNSLTNTPEH